LIIQAKTDISRGNNTLRKFIAKYAPPSENLTDVYISAVSKRTGIDPDRVMTSSKETIRKLVSAISHVENGGDYIVPDDFEAAWSLV